MVARRALPCVLAALALYTPATRADAWRTKRAARSLVAPWQHCPDLHDALEEDAAAPTMFARRIKVGVDVQLVEDGSGRWGSHYERHLQLRRGSCAHTGYELGGLKEGLVFGLSRARSTDGATVSLEDVAIETESVRPAIDDRAFAAERLLVQCGRSTHPCDSVRDSDDSKATSNALFVTQPERPGRPTGSPRGLWTADDLRSAGVDRLAKLDDSDDAPPEALVAGAIPEPVLLTRRGTLELWERRFRARNGGGMLALYDGKRDRHRWVFVTTEDRQEGSCSPPGEPRRSHGVGHFLVISFDEERLLVSTSFEGRDALFAIDVQSGVARPLVTPAHHVAFRRVGAEVEAAELDDDDRPTGVVRHVALPR